MTDPIKTLLPAYYDSELPAARVRHIEAHLAECADCRAELERLRSLSGLLHTWAAPPIATSPERFVAQVMLQLPHTPIAPGQVADAALPHRWWPALLIGLRQSVWRMAPLLLLGAWFGLRAVTFLNALVALLQRSGLEQAWFGGYSVNSYAAALLRASAFLLPLGAPWLLILLIPLGIGVLYASWIAGWWLSQQSALSE